jgi:hypothetical protein
MKFGKIKLDEQDDMGEGCTKLTADQAGELGDKLHDAAQSMDELDGLKYTGFVLLTIADGKVQVETTKVKVAKSAVKDDE